LNNAQPLLTTEESFEAQPHDVRHLARDVLDRLVVSFTRMDGRYVPLAFYTADVWPLAGGTTNNKKSERKLDFRRLPVRFRATAKQMAWRYLRRGRDGGKRPKTGTLVSWLKVSSQFFAWLTERGIKRLRDVSPMVCVQYVEATKAYRSRSGKPLVAGTLAQRFLAVEAIHELSHWTADPMPSHPWPDSSAAHLAGIPKGRAYVGKTPLIPDDLFCALFRAAWSMVQKGDYWLDLRDGLERIEVEFAHLRRRPIEVRKNKFLVESGWHAGLRSLGKQLLHLRTACYIVVASLSGCRNHEIAYVRNDPCYSTTDDEGEVYWWMKSCSDKTDEGQTEWMIPLAAVQVLKIMERWAKPFQASIEAEIVLRRKANPDDPEIAEAMKHRDAIFLGASNRHGNLVRTLSNNASGDMLRDFLAMLGLGWEWDLTTHQFRRKFANYAARSRYGDLRYLKEHFKHWSMDMTFGYALNESQDLDLYLDIEAEMDSLKLGVVGEWLRDDVPLAGGFGTNIVEWRGTHPIALFKDRAAMVRSLADSISLRSTLHAWCAADRGECSGPEIGLLVNCTDCDNGVIHQRHAHIYQRQYRELKSLLGLKDIGESGLNRVRSAMAKCRGVLERLCIDPDDESVLPLGVAT
jgi:integrase